MSRYCRLIILLVVLVSGCQSSIEPLATSEPQVVSSNTPIPAPTETPPPSATPVAPTEAASATATPPAEPTETPIPAATETPTPSPQIGEIRTSETGLSEIFANGEWIAPPIAPDYFNPSYLTIVDGVTQYRSPGLTVDWSSETNSWVFPERLPYKSGEVVPLSLMGGKLEINNQEEAMRVSREIVLAWLNNPGNHDYLRAVYDKDQITWEDLRVSDPVTGEDRYVVKLMDLMGSRQWPNTVFVDTNNDGKVGYSNLGDTFEEPGTIGHLDVTSPIMFIAGWLEWPEEHLFIEDRTTGPQSQMGTSWANYGIRFTKDGRLVTLCYSTNYFDGNGLNVDESILGGRSGEEIEPKLASGYLAAILETLKRANSGVRHLYATPYYSNPSVTWENSTLPGLTQDMIDAIVSPDTFKSTN